MKEIEEQIRMIPVVVRLDMALKMISAMCGEGRCPKMSVPTQSTDEDIFITTTLRDAKEIIADFSGAQEVTGDVTITFCNVDLWNKLTE